MMSCSVTAFLGSAIVASVRTSVRHPNRLVQRATPRLDEPVNTELNPGHALPYLEETILATTRYLEALTELSDDDCRAPSLLPRWSRGHVITHLSRNADGLCRLLHWGQTGVEAPMYASNESRDADIEAGADRPAAELRADASASAGRFLQAANELHSSRLGALVTRTAGSPPFAVSDVGRMRRSEVEIHHADLGIGYTAHDWPADFVRQLVEGRADDLAGRGIGMVWRLTDLDETVAIGEGGPEVIGPAADLAWWLIGRGNGEGLSCSDGALPTIGAWR
jgi:maleylpyruvate isomerase